MPWSKKFREPITLPNGEKLIRLADAGEYILKLSAEKQVTQAWMLAAEMLIKAAEEGGGWLDLARIGIMQAILGPTPPPEPGPGAPARNSEGAKGCRQVPQNSRGNRHGSDG